ncbi:kunitz-type protease inhibitor 2 [Trematomus bernacchii]|uniref:kunitz-type protease inhibitor 2 n=1 Tax=Trematomus bernacchii TaxID=40690 RepID=UPI00146C16E5|nr:kunitz-type protease inhibitor 2 [Trematomus bernacchii]
MLLLLLLSSALLQVQLQTCDWDPDLNPDQQLLSGPDPARLLEVSGPRACRAACCSDPDCDLALMGLPADGLPQCMLVRCRDHCVFQPSSQFKVYRKKSLSLPGTQALKPGERRRVVPLMEAGEPRSNETNDLRCLLPPQVGSCRASFPRFFYNVSSQICSHFLFGGCHGNGNNFLTKGGCEESCGGVTGAVLPVDSTPAPELPAKAPRMNLHSVRVLPSSKKAPPPAADTDSEACTVTSDPGPCRAAFPMFYYDLNTASCQTFLYGGCRGNRNRYSSLEDCMTRCQNTGSFDTRGKARDRWTAAVFLFVTLAVVSTLLLTTLVIITLRRHRLSRLPSSFSDKEELLPDEQSSVESLNVSESPKPDQA